MKKLKVLTWNLGYGAMGAEADISFEGGRKFIPSSDEAVKENIAGIKRILTKTQADVYLLQELSAGSLLNRWNNIRKAVYETLPNHTSSRVSNFQLPLFFDFLKNEHGMGTFVKDSFNVFKKQIRPFKVSEYYYKIIPRLDFALTTFVETQDGKTIAFVNTHLSSFDEHGVLRMSQFLDLMTYIKKLAKDGHSVIAGADWNLHAGKINFFEKDEIQYEKYNHDFPYHLLKNGWTAHFPTDIPTLRAANRPYVEGKSTTATVDGFICSPDITVECVNTLDLKFKHSDHNPVEIVLSC
ncbi:endonuclease/exonuclease/phosphatase family protein [Candidatus Kaiserbacteria bacterium]|nr:MAG: endonuclease/exonuclease/phosphatase family protein [Candidatus Kaiserbacteria bacterium]